MQPLHRADPPRVGPYTLLGRLGAGGMGTVYLGRSAGGRSVAVKVIRPELADDTGFRERFRQEVAAARRVSGAFTAPVVDADPDGERPWLATAFVPGRSLQYAVETHGPLPEDALGALAAGIAEALTGIHAAGLVHRDLKPANVLLALDGPHVIDFGISRAVDATGLTATGAVVGSPGFLAPEQALGEAVGPATDLFALGALLVFAASGRGAFGEGAAPALLFRVVSAEPDLSAVPASLREVVAACLAKDPARRPTPRQVVEAIERAAPAVAAGGWLPHALMSDVLAASAAMAGAPGPDRAGPVGREPDGPGNLDPRTLPLAAASPSGPATRPSRRGLLLGLAGGAVAVAGGATAAVLELAKGGSGGAKKGGAAAAGQRGVLAGPEAEPLWTATAVEDCSVLAPAKGVLACAGAGHVWALDGAGRPAWGPMNLVNGSGPGFSTMAAADGTLYAYGIQPNAEVQLSAIDIASGNVSWGYQLPVQEPVGFRVIAVENGLVYLVSSMTPVLAAVDVATRKLVWQCPLGQVGGVSLLLPTLGRFLSSSTSADRQTVHTRMIDLTNPAEPVVGWQRDVPGEFGDACLANGKLVFAGDHLYALDPATGNQLWASKESDHFQAPVAGPDGTLVFVMSFDTMYAFDAGTGALRWKTQPAATTPAPGDDGSPMAYAGMSVPICADGNLYVFDGHRVLWALDPTTGATRWKYSGARQSESVVKDVVRGTGGGRIYLADQVAKTIVALSASGR